MTAWIPPQTRIARSPFVTLALAIPLALAWPNLGCPPGPGGPVITSITPADQGVGETLDIAGSGFGATAGEVLFSGLRAPDSAILDWDEGAISVAIPEGAHSGDIQVVSALGETSDGEGYEIDYWQAIHDSFKVSHPDEFRVKGIGGFGGATRVESEGGWTYLVASTAVATLDTTVEPPAMTSLFYPPSKTANIQLRGDHVFLVGGYGLAIYRKADLQTGGFDPMDPPRVAAWTAGETLVDVDVREYAGAPLDGTLVAALETPDDHTLHFFDWDPVAEVLELIATHTDTDLFPDRSANQLALDPVHPKLYVATEAPFLGSHIVEYDLTDLDAVVRNGEVQLPVTRLIGDVEAMDDKVWVSTWGIDVDFVDPQPSAMFWAYQSHPGATLLAEYGYIDACTVDDEGPGHPSCANDGDCNVFTMGHECFWGEQSCECRDSVCQVCRTATTAGHLDVIEGEGLVVGITGMSTDDEFLDNVFLMDAASADHLGGDHAPLASSESNDWAYDVSGHPGGIAIADEWTNSQLLRYETWPTFTIEHHPEPAWTDPTRTFGAGLLWSWTQAWTHDGRLYYGDNLYSIDLTDPGDIDGWYDANGDNHRPWWVSAGAHRDDVIFAKGPIENFLVGYAGAYLQVYLDDVVNRRLVLLNDPEDHVYYPTDTGPKQSGVDFAERGYPTAGNVLWLADNVVVTPLANHGLCTFYVDSELTGGACAVDDDCPGGGCAGGLCRHAEIVELADADTGEVCLEMGFVDDNGLQAAQVVNEIELVTGDVHALGGGWVKNSVSAPVPASWGGISFVEIDFPSGPPTPADPSLPVDIDAADPAQVHCLQGHAVGDLVVGDVNGEIWIAATLYDPPSDLNFIAGSGPVEVVLFRFTDLPAMNAACLHPDDRDYLAGDCEDQLAAITVADGNYDPQPDASQTPKSIEFWVDGTLAVGVERGVGPGSGPSGVYVFEVAAEPGVTPLVQRYFYPASLKPIYTSWATGDIWRSYPDVNDYLLPNVVHLVRHGDDLVAINHAGNFTVLGD